MLAEGSSFNAIKRQLQTTAPTIVRWKQRFRQYGLEGLDTYHPGQKASVLTPALRARILSATRRKPSDGSTHWSCRKLASALGVSKDAVHRVWQEAGLKPYRLERYMASDDPEFESKAADILGLYLRPPQHAAVFCVDEKTAIQALDRLDPVLPLSPGRAERHGFEYYRHSMPTPPMLGPASGSTLIPPAASAVTNSLRQATSTWANSPGPARPRSMGRLGAAACTMWSHLRQLNFGRTWRITKKFAGAYSSISLTSSPSLRNVPPQSVASRFFRFVPLRLT